MKMLVVRHAPAEIPSAGTTEPALTPTGRQQLTTTCEKLDSLKLSFDRLLHSPLLRAVQTANIFCNFFPVKHREESELLRPNCDPALLFESLKKDSQEQSLVLVGHQPFLGDFISLSLTDTTHPFVSLERGGMAFLKFSGQVIPGAGVLTALLTHRIF